MYSFQIKQIKIKIQIQIKIKIQNITAFTLTMEARILWRLERSTSTRRRWPNPSLERFTMGRGTTERPIVERWWDSPLCTKEPYFRLPWMRKTPREKRLSPPKTRRPWKPRQQLACLLTWIFWQVFLFLFLFLFLFCFCVFVFLFWRFCTPLEKEDNASCASPASPASCVSPASASPVSCDIPAGCSCSRRFYFSVVFLCTSPRCSTIHGHEDHPKGPPPFEPIGASRPRHTRLQAAKISSEGGSEGFH